MIYPTDSRGQFCGQQGTPNEYVSRLAPIAHRHLGIAGETITLGCCTPRLRDGQLALPVLPALSSGCGERLRPCPLLGGAEKHRSSLQLLVFGGLGFFGVLHPPSRAGRGMRVLPIASPRAGGSPNRAFFFFSAWFALQEETFPLLLRYREVCQPAGAAGVSVPDHAGTDPGFEVLRQARLPTARLLLGEAAVCGVPVEGAPAFMYSPPTPCPLLSSRSASANAQTGTRRT